MATVERPNNSLRILFARAAVLVIAAATLLALTGARPADAPATAPLDQIAQAPVDQPFELPDTTEDEEDDADTLDVVPPSAQQQAPPPASPAVEDTTGAFRPDLNTVPPGATADSSATGAAPDTLFMPSGVLPTNPQPTTTTTTQPQATPPLPGPKQEVKKPRKGLLGIHPVAILFGLAALHIMVTHLAE
ncbi:MAG TPA: hypothetical protein VFR25_02525 [Candidatus Eisenbacteria bacterium]|nr:hypothetical protein [Candidatus Eisenbacteria bacterium]